ncbi:MAG: M48 family metallopeptidase [Minisyncoccia bacterium]
MSVYQQVEKNIFRTWLFIFLFSFIIILLGIFFAYFFNLPEIFYFALFLSFFQGFLSYWYCDKFILSFSKAKPLKKEEYPEVYNLVENLAITAGLSTPKIYILDDDSINAFATGRNPKNSVICLTRGAIEKLDKLELEGVIAHEFSHIKNNDILLLSVIAILVSGIAYLSRLIFRFDFYSEDRKRENTGFVILIGFLVAIFAYLFAYLLKLAISRKREFLADASAVLLTRYPQGLINAFKKISLDTKNTQVFIPLLPIYIYLILTEKEKKGNGF